MSEDEIGTLYCDLMEELKARVQTVSEVVAGVGYHNSEQHLRHNVFILEGLYLQLRKCCELLATSLLITQANSDHHASLKNSFGEYRADKLLSRIEKINPKSFPRPVGPGDWVAGKTQLVSEYPPVFTAIELKTLYFKCDVRLHWGTLNKLLGGKVTELRQDFIEDWVSKLLDGLRNHVIDLPQRGRSMLVQMTDPETGRVCSRFATFAK